MNQESGFSIGIDVACAKGKILPIAGVEWKDESIDIVNLRGLETQPPRGMGNEALVRAPGVAKQFAEQTAKWLTSVEADLGKKITKVVIDAPRMPCVEGGARRRSEIALSEVGPALSCFSTPTRARFEEKRAEAIARLDNGGNASNIVAANLWWMEVGFALFEVLGNKWTCLETYPYAVLTRSGYRGAHKSKAHAAQLKYFSSKALGREVSPTMLQRLAYGAPSDRLDALMCAWIGTLRPEECEALGEGDDCIVVWKGEES